MRSFWTLFLSTLVLVSLFFSLCHDYQSGSYFYIEKYGYQLNQNNQKIIIGNDEHLSDITIENDHSDSAHLELSREEDFYTARNISDQKKVDINGRYLKKLLIRENDRLEINGREKIEIIRINRQFPLGRSITLSISLPGGNRDRIITLTTFLTKRIVLGYGRAKEIRSGFSSLEFPSDERKAFASLGLEMKTSLMGVNLYYYLVFICVFLISIAITLYLKNQFNGALLIFMFCSMPFMAGFLSMSTLLLISLGFAPLIFIVQLRRRTRWKPLSVMVLIAFASLFLLPEIIDTRGEFTLSQLGGRGSNSILVKRGGRSFYLDENSRDLSYGENHEVILGYTRYRLHVTPEKAILQPLNPERIEVSKKIRGIISDLKQVEAGKDYLYLKFPHHFKPIQGDELQKKRLTIGDGSGHFIQIARRESNLFAGYSRGFVLIILFFTLFWIMSVWGFSLGSFHFFRFNLLKHSNFFIFNFIYFMLSLGYIMLGLLSLTNNYFIKNFEKFRNRALLLFIILLFCSLVASRYNKPLVLIYRILRHKKFQIPLVLGLGLLFLSVFSPIFLVIGAGYLIFVFLIRLRKDLIYEYQNVHNHPLNLKALNEKSITPLNQTENQRILFGLGRLLYRQGWDCITTSDLLLLLSLFFIVLQVFLGGELGVSVGGFFFLPVELAKILLTVYFADWVSRIDRGMRLNVLWIYGLVLVPFFMLVLFLKDFSPLLVFSFVFLYHIIKIKKSIWFKATVIGILLITLSISVWHIREYTFPFQSSPFNLLFSIASILVFLLALLKLWIGKYAGRLKSPAKLAFTLILMVLLIVPNFLIWQGDLPVPKVLGDRISSWLNPWRDFNLSYQYINSLWLMKGSGWLGKPARFLESASRVPLVEQDLSFSLYVSSLGIIGIIFIFLTLFLLFLTIRRLVMGEGGASSQWNGYLLEFLTVIFSAQFIFPILYAVGLLPIMSQPLPFLSYSNNMLLLFTLPFALLLLIQTNNMEKS